MMALIQWYARQGDSDIEVTSSSGLGFFGALGFGAAIHTGVFNESTFITGPSGTIQGVEVINNKYIDASSVLIWGSGSYHGLDVIPNNKTTLRVSFSHSSDVTVQNAWFTACDRENITLGPGLNVYAAEICHTSEVYDTSAYSDTIWTAVSGSGVVLTLSDSPGASGEYSGAGVTGSGTQHDWYITLSVSPSSGGHKYFAVYCELEYI